MAPPGPPPPNIHNATSPPAEIAYNAVRSHLAKSDPASCASDPPILASKMQLITVHPSQPLVAYYLEQDHAASTNSGATSNDNSANLPPTTVKLIQVQHLQTRNVLWTCYLSDLAAMLFDYDPLDVDAAKKFPAAIKTLGHIQSMQFFDPSTLYFSGMADPVEHNVAVERWQTLLVQFDRRIVLLNLRKGPSTTARLVPSNSAEDDDNMMNDMMKINGSKRSSPGAAARNFYSPILCHLTKETGLNNSPPSSNALPLTKSLLLLGCADGTFKCFDWKKGKLQKSIKGLGKNDWIVHLIAANRYPSLEETTSGSSTTSSSLDQSGDDHTSNNNNNSNEPRVRRFITVTKKGTAYLIEVVVSPDGIDIRPPLARFEGGASPAILTWLDDAANAEGGQHHFEHQLLNYDPDRDIFMWGLPSTKSKQAQKVFCWDLHSLQEQFITEKGGKSVYKPEPTLVIQFPFEGEVAAFPAWSHSAFPDDAIVCAVVTKKGDLYIMGATRAGTSGSATILASAITSTNIRAVIQRDTAMVTLPLLQVHYVGCASLWDSGVLLLGSNLGVVMVDFEREHVVPGARHIHFGAGLGSLGKSVLFVKHSSVVYGSVDAFRANPVGRMEIKNTLDVYESPAATHLPAEIQKRSFRLPPSFLPSPSGMFICLFWNEEMRYEVLHLPSVLQRVSQRGKDNTSAAAVASGTGVSSFAWIGENDLFAIIHSPDADKLGQASSLDAVTPTITGESKDFAAVSAQKLKDLTDIRNLGSNLKDLADVKGLAVNTTKGAAKVVTSTAKVATAVGGATASVATSAVHKTTKFITFGGRLTGRNKKKPESETTAMTADGDDLDDKAATMAPTQMVQPGMYDPNAKKSVKRAYVEIKEINALETAQPAISGTIAPATASTLGELSLRGGNRIPPKVLFGGPVICVGCRSEDEEGMAYFYTEKKGATDKSASSYVSSGPSIPYPDLVVWDDDGKLCAVVIQSRVAIYLSDQPDFILLGTVRVGSPADPDGAAISVKFIHGILYCCTRSSIEIVFLGDRSGGICHLDSLTLASTAVHSLPGRQNALNCDDAVRMALNELLLLIIFLFRLTSQGDLF